jgi:hypothetical protein
MYFPVEKLVSQPIVMPGTPAIELLRAQFSPEGHTFFAALAKNRFKLLPNGAS